MLINESGFVFALHVMITWVIFMQTISYHIKWGVLDRFLQNLAKI